MAFNIQYSFDLVDKLSTKLKKIDKNIKNTAQSVRRSTAKMNSGFDSMKTKLDGVSRKAKEVGKSLFLKLTVPVGLLGASFIKAASDAEETSSKFATVFKDVGKEAETTANTIAKSFGLSSVKAKELLGDTGDLLTGFGFTGKAALDLAAETNKLAVDLASFTNFSGGAEGASKALTKALLGERESVKSLGISILEEDVKAKVKSLTATGALTGMTERQAKAYATLQIAISQSKNAIGDYERTSQGFANTTRKLTQRFFDLKVSLGNIILPLALKLVNVTIKLIDKFNALSPMVKKIILVVGGLAVVLSPLLLVIGLMAPAITAITAAIKIMNAAILANPIGLILALVAGGIVLFIRFKKKVEELGFTLADIPRLALDSFKRNFPLLTKIIKFALTPIMLMKQAIESLFDIAGNAANFISQKISSAKELLGFGGAEQTTNINQNQNSNVQGSIDVNFNNIPKGTNVVSNMGGNTDLNLGTNQVYGSAL
jgi:hypothetical protein